MIHEELFQEHLVFHDHLLILHNRSLVVQDRILVGQNILLVAENDITTHLVSLSFLGEVSPIDFTVGFHGLILGWEAQAVGEAVHERKAASLV